MIHYDLRCPGEHAFDGWFRDSAAFEHQARLGLIACPHCADTRVTRALMTPSLGRGAAAPVVAEAKVAPEAAPAESSGPVPMPDQVRAMLQRLRAEVETRCDYVGSRFADEARRLHARKAEGDTTPQGIYGETTPAEAEALADEGIEVGRIPWVPPADA